MTKLHQIYHIPHLIITSIEFSTSSSSPTLSIAGSTARRDRSPRCFKIDVPALDCSFTGTGDMFAALTVARLREATQAAGLHTVKSWLSPDEVLATDLPLASAAEKVVGSMHSILLKTKKAWDEALAEMKLSSPPEEGALGEAGEAGEAEKAEKAEREMRLKLRMVEAAEVRVVRNVGDLTHPDVLWRAEGF